MTLDHLAQQRLRNERLVGPGFASAREAVAWLGAVQAQDYQGAKWALSQRTNDLTDAAIEEEFNSGQILRTHVMRPTWHFVAPEDIGWLLALTAPRIQAVSAYYYRQNGLDAAVFKRSHAALATALQGGTFMTRTELAAVLDRARIPAKGLRLGLLVMRAELDRIICSGPRRGKHVTYASFAERAPRATLLSPDDALAELTRRYFTSHGPATLRDYVWWSGLTSAQARAGVQMLGSTLVEQVIDGRTYWHAETTPARRRPGPMVHLLPNYDEYFIAYKDRHLVLPSQAGPRRPDPYAHQMAISGWLAGSWTRTIGKASAVVTASTYRPLTAAESRALAEAAARYGRFLGMPVTLASATAKV